jgi:hypothetical protein
MSLTPSQPDTEQIPESSEPEAAPTTPAPEQVLDLETVSKFKYGGREWTPKDFQGAYMMQSDYTRKTQALAEERKYFDNLQADLDAIKQNPSLAPQFKSIYPEKYHKYLGYVVPEQDMREKPSNTPGIDPEIMADIKAFKDDLRDRKIQSASAEIDAICGKLSKQYPMADEEAVLARASAVLERGDKLTPEVWNDLWKNVHDKNQKLADQYYSGKVNQQKTANSKGKDSASGGGMPGMAPNRPKTIKEASAMALKELEQA